VADKAALSLELEFTRHGPRGLAISGAELSFVRVCLYCTTDEKAKAIARVGAGRKGDLKLGRAVIARVGCAGVAMQC
jgi:hypothetical protein